MQYTFYWWVPRGGQRGPFSESRFCPTHGLPISFMISQKDFFVKLPVFCFLAFLPHVSGWEMWHCEPETCCIHFLSHSRSFSCTFCYIFQFVFSTSHLYFLVIIPEILKRNHYVSSIENEHTFSKKIENFRKKNIRLKSARVLYYLYILYLFCR
jgi:hypothetical protein